MAQPLLQSVDNALRVLELFEGAIRELSLTEIARQLSLGKSTVHRLLATLEAREFVEQSPESGRYRLGVRLVHIGACKLSNINVIDECHPILDELAGITGETTHLTFYSGGRTTVVDKVKGSNPTVMATIIGQTTPAYAAASGKIFLAFLPKDELESILRHIEFKPRTPYTINNRVQLLEELEKVRVNGYAEDQQEGDEGLVCFAAPIWGYENKLLASMSVGGAASRMNSRRDSLIREIIAAAAKASKRCGGQTL
ncbi:MAG: IclR family transcriptional regulator [Planctomycetaceae bacterium]|nr:IclR family transcriptional regulator [Planctomycetaceae bacterium]